MVSANKLLTKTRLSLDEDLGKINTRRPEETPFKIFLKMDNTLSHRGKKLFGKIPFTEFFTRHHNNNNHNNHKCVTTIIMRLLLANQKMLIADGPFFKISFFIFLFFSLEFPFSAYFVFFFPFFRFSFQLL